MTEQFDAILRRWGRDVTLDGSGGKNEVRAFVQPIQKQQTDAPEEPTAFGAADLRRWLYIGPKDAALEAGNTVRCGEERYTVQTAAAVYVGAEQSHWWAILRPAREELT